VHVISRKRLREFWVRHPDAEGPLSAWFKVASRAQWRKFADVRSYHSAADLVDGLVVFNIGGNKYRLITEIYYRDQVILVRHVLTHKDYDKGHWRVRPTKPTTTNGATARPPGKENP
jgi:mRNA interferase HigB